MDSIEGIAVNRKIIVYCCQGNVYLGWIIAVSLRIIAVYGWSIVISVRSIAVCWLIETVS